MPRLPHRRLDERSAHAIPARNAQRVWDMDGVDWPVSGDETLRAHGRIAVRLSLIHI